MPVVKDVHEITLLLAEALSGAGVPYAIGGAIAYGFYGAPRGTVDVDLNIFVRAEEARPALEALRKAGLGLDVNEAMDSLEKRGDTRAAFTGVRVDLFVNSIDLHESAMRRTVPVPLSGRQIRILSAEDLALFKLIFFRPKDVEDIKRMVARLGTNLDVDYLRNHLVGVLGKDDERVIALEDILSEFGMT